MRWSVVVCAFVLVLACSAVVHARGYTARAAGLDLNDNGIAGESGIDDTVCDDMTGTGPIAEDYDGDGTVEQQYYVDCDAGSDSSTCGGPDNPCASLLYAFRNRADGPGNGEDAVCFRGTCTPENLNPGVSGSATIFTKTASDSEEWDFQFPSNPAMLVGWDADNDNEYPPYDTDDTALLYGTCTLSRAFDTTIATSHFEFSHFKAKDYGCAPFPDQDNSGFKDGNCQWCYWHDIETSGINRDRNQNSGTVVLSTSTIPNQEYEAFVNVLFSEVGGYFMRGGAGAGAGPMRMQRITMTAHPSDSGLPGNSGEFSIMKVWGQIDKLEILDSVFDANLADWDESNGGATLNGVGAAQCAEVFIRNNLIIDFAIPFSVQCANAGFCTARPTKAVFDSNVAFSTVDFSAIGYGSAGFTLQNGGSASTALTDCGEVDFFNNIVRLDDPGALVRILNGNDGGLSPTVLRVYGNTFYASELRNGASGNAIEIASSLTYKPESLDFRNNIFAGWSDGGDNILTTYAPSNLTSDNNVWNSDAGSTFNWNNGGETNLANWQTNSNGDASSVQCDPSFVDQVSGDLHLQSGDTCAQNAGTPITGTPTDIDGDSRPQGLGWDIGADEVVSGGPSCHWADTDCNSDISIGELVAVVLDWQAGGRQIAELVTVVLLWQS